ncbi:DNA topoisomerase, partial [Pseudomonas sp. 65/3-MNA-CIBAN-0223]
QIRVADSAQVVSVETERVREGPPLPFDLGTLQEVCSKQLGLDVQETLDIAQALYETHKATTYPRSDSGYLPESMFAEVPTVLD